MQQSDREYWLDQVEKSREATPFGIAIPAPMLALRHAIQDAQRWENGCKNESRSAKQFQERLAQQNKDFNAALDFAVDELRNDGDVVLFLTWWREGDWKTIKTEFPEFKLSKELETGNV